MKYQLSTRATNLLARLRAGRWYHAYAPGTPAAMQELLDAGLVTTMGRVQVMKLCYVPVGSKPFRLEKIAGCK